MVKCSQCGILDKPDLGKVICHFSKKDMGNQVDEDRHCHMFINKKEYRDEDLTPDGYLILRKGEIESKK
ncbi:MAG: hypothetical protein Q7I94_01260 [Candidatus Contubernalis sp.]|nr:hypothetical protein [Candidatus Contubernalis sp.]